MTAGIPALCNYVITQSISSLTTPDSRSSSNRHRRIQLSPSSLWPKLVAELLMLQRSRKSLRIFQSVYLSSFRALKECGYRDVLSSVTSRYGHGKSLRLFKRFLWATYIVVRTPTVSPMRSQLSSEHDRILAAGLIVAAHNLDCTWVAHMTTWPERYLATPSTFLKSWSYRSTNDP